MRREGAIRLSFCGLFLLVFMSMGAGALAQENMCIVPTSSGQALNQLSSALTIIASAEEISPSEPVYLRAAWGCYPYQYSWEIDGMGYSLSKTTTKGELDYTLLTVEEGTCGEQNGYDPYATVTVTDSCAGDQSIVIRNSEGTWNGIMGCGGPCGENCGPWQEIVVGQCRWVFRCCTPYWGHCPVSECGPPGDIPGGCADELGELLRTEACPGKCAEGTHSCLNVAYAQNWGCPE